MTEKHSDLGNWMAQLRGQDSSANLKDRLDDIDRQALDSKLSFAAEHTRRYIATDGADDGWDGPRPILILYTTGRRSGQLRRNPLLYFDHAGTRYLVGSLGGAPKHPEWYLNLRAQPLVHVRVMADVYEATARTVDAEERAVLWPELVARYPVFGEYEAKTDRQIPLVQLVPVAN